MSLLMHIEKCIRILQSNG